MKLSTTVLGIAFLCAASALGAAAIQGTQTPEKQTPQKQAPEKPAPEKGSAVPASMPKVQPTREHSELLKLVGTWDSTMTMMKPGAAPVTSKATLVYKPIGELWVASEISGEMMGTPFSNRGFEGFDTEKKKIVSVSVDSMSSEVKTYEGTYDPATKTTTLTGKCRDMESGKVVEHRIVSTLSDENTMVCHVFARGDDGKDTEVAKIESKRRK